MWIETSVTANTYGIVTYFIRQKWRMWIETIKNAPSLKTIWISSARNGGCGLKLPAIQCPTTGGRISSARNGGCGLKHGANLRSANLYGDFIRQKWRMWIETGEAALGKRGHDISSARNGGCGLKLYLHSQQLPGHGDFIRQKWRMWIETHHWVVGKHAAADFIRQKWRMWIETSQAAPEI